MTMLMGTGCTDRKASSDDSTYADTLLRDTLPEDSLETLLEEQPVPKAADELFDDFIFNFAANKRLQRERTDFPLKVDVYGKIKTVERNNWVMEHFFMRQDYYTLIFNSEKQMGIMRDTSVTHVTVEKISVDKNQLEEWYFNRVNGLWRLQLKSIASLNSHKDAQFIKFYNDFVTDSLFQSQSLAEEVSISCPDPDDDFSRIDGEVMPEQWSAFTPWMPSGTLYNIHYGIKPYKNTNTRLFLIRGIANGLGTELTFIREGEKWVLKKMNT